MKDVYIFHRREASSGFLTSSLCLHVYITMIVVRVIRKEQDQYVRINLCHLMNLGIEAEEEGQEEGEEEEDQPEDGSLSTQQQPQTDTSGTNPADRLCTTDVNMV